MNMRQHGKGRFKCSQISRIGTLIADAAHQTLQIIHCIQILTDFFSCKCIIVQFFNCIKTLLNFLFINQRLLNTTTQISGTHCSFCLIKNPQQRSSFLLFTHCFNQFQITTCWVIDGHIFSGHIRNQFCNMYQRILLCLSQILHDGACCANTGIIAG